MQGSQVLGRKSGQEEINFFWQGIASGFLRQGLLWLISNFIFLPELFCTTFRTYLVPQFPVNVYWYPTVYISVVLGVWRNESSDPHWVQQLWRNREFSGRGVRIQHEPSVLLEGMDGVSLVTNAVSEMEDQVSFWIFWWSFRWPHSRGCQVGYLKKLRGRLRLRSVRTGCGRGSKMGSMATPREHTTHSPSFGTVAVRRVQKQGEMSHSWTHWLKPAGWGLCPSPTRTMRLLAPWGHFGR